MSRNRAFCITTNNYTDADLTAHVKELEQTEYGIIGKEIGEKEKTPHLQCYFRYQNARAFTSMAKKFKTSHIEVAQGDDTSNRAYCSKEGDFLEHGTPKVKAPGKRNDLEEFVEVARAEPITWKQVVMEHPQIAANHPDWAKNVISITREERIKRTSPVADTPRPWQSIILGMMEQEPDDRHILWIYDEKGASGKTALARYMVDKFGAFYTNGGKANDIAYSYDCEPVVIFDYVRDARDFVSYGVIEALKNGILSSNKYQSATKRFDPPHVIVFANFEPEPGKFSKDRIIQYTPDFLDSNYGESLDD